MKDFERRVVITGLGAITPCGLDVPTFWASVRDGVSAIDFLPSEIAHDYAKVGTLVKGFDPLQYLDRKEIRTIHRVQQFAYAAGTQALQDAGFLDHNADLLAETLDLQGIDPERLASVISTGGGGLTHVAEIEDAIVKKGSRFISPTRKNL